MHRLAPAPAGLLLLALALAACTDAGATRTAGQAAGTAVARFVPGGEVTVVQVTVNDRLPLRSADLVGPDGAVVPAYSIDTSQVAEYPQPSYGAAPSSGIGTGGMFFGGGTSYGSGVGAAVPLPFGGDGLYGAPGSQVVTSSEIHSTALIRLVDPESYRQEWQLWQIRLRIGDPPSVSFVSLPAPQPPAAL